MKRYDVKEIVVTEPLNIVALSGGKDSTAMAFLDTMSRDDTESVPCRACRI